MIRKEKLEKLRDELAEHHRRSLTPLDEKNDHEGFLYIDKRFGSFCYGFDAALELLWPVVEICTAMENEHSHYTGALERGTLFTKHPFHGVFDALGNNARSALTALDESLRGNSEIPHGRGK